MTQAIIVYITGALLACFLVYRLIRLFTGKRRIRGSCPGCSDCPVSKECSKNCEL